MASHMLSSDAAAAHRKWRSPCSRRTPAPSTRHPSISLSLAFQFLSEVDLLHASKTCTHWRAVACSPLTFRGAVRISVCPLADQPPRLHCECVRVRGPACTFRRWQACAGAAASRLFQHFSILTLAPSKTSEASQMWQHLQRFQSIRSLTLRRSLPTEEGLVVDALQSRALQHLQHLQISYAHLHQRHLLAHVPSSLVHLEVVGAFELDLARPDETRGQQLVRDLEPIVRLAHLQTLFLEDTRDLHAVAAVSRLLADHPSADLQVWTPLLDWKKFVSSAPPIDTDVHLVRHRAKTIVDYFRRPSAEPADIRAHFARLLSLLPDLESVRFVSVDPVAIDLYSSGHGDEPIRHWNSPRQDGGDLTTNVTSLIDESTGWKHAAHSWLRGSGRAFARLHTLSVDTADLKDSAWAEFLSHTPLLTDLHANRLILTDCRAFGHLVQLKRLSGVRWEGGGPGSWTVSGMAALARQFPSLETLDIRGIDLSTSFDGARMLVAFPQADVVAFVRAIPTLERLRLHPDGEADTCLESLADLDAFMPSHLDQCRARAEAATRHKQECERTVQPTPMTSPFQFEPMATALPRTHDQPTVAPEPFVFQSSSTAPSTETAQPNGSGASPFASPFTFDSTFGAAAPAATVAPVGPSSSSPFHLPNSTSVSTTAAFSFPPTSHAAAFSPSFDPSSAAAPSSLATAGVSADAVSSAPSNSFASGFSAAKSSSQRRSRGR